MVITSRKTRLSMLLPFIVQLCTRRRAMVNKIWCRKVARAWLPSKSEVPHPRVFSEPCYGEDVRIWYLVYRCFILFAWLTIVVCSLFELGSKEPLGHNELWPIYLTNWHLTLCTAQASLSSWLVWRRLKSQTAPDFDPMSLSFGKVEKLYWFLYVSACTLAIKVSVSYWCAVFEPKIHHADTVNVMVHGVNSVLMIIDLCVTKVPHRLRHFWWPLTIAFAYLIFSVTYYCAGGLDKRGCTYIYKILDWQKPGFTLLVCLVGLIVLVIVHCLLCLLAAIRERCYARNDSEKYARKTIASLTTEQSTMKRAEIIV